MHWSSQSNQLKIKVKIFGPEDFIGLVLSIFINPLFFVMVSYFIFKIVALKKGLTQMELMRRMLKGSSREARKTRSLSVKKRVSLLDIATRYLPVVFVCFMFTGIGQNAFAGFEIVDEKKNHPVTNASSVYLPFSEVKSGFGNDVRLEDVVSILVNKPWQFQFISKEIKALKVSWLSKGSTVSEIIAQLGRNYGVEAYYVQSAGEIHLDWASGFCHEKIKDEKARREAFNKQILLGAKDESFPSVFTVKRDERVYLC